MDLLVIKTEDNAWQALTQALEDKLDENVQVEFQGWPEFKITLAGEDFNSTMPTRVMPPILELQKEIYRLYCRAKYNDENTRRLSDEERKLLELIVEVKPGSSEYITRLFRALNEIIRNTNMTGKEVVILLVSVSTLITGDYAWKNWLQTKEREHNLDVSVRMSEEETRRLEIVTQAMRHNPEIAEVKNAINEVRSELVKKLQPTDQLKINKQVARMQRSGIRGSPVSDDPGFHCVASGLHIMLEQYREHKKTPRDSVRRRYQPA